MLSLRELRKKHNIHPDKSRGQNFLIDKNVLRKIVEAAELSKDDVVIEIGAGTGVLTEELVQRAGRVIAFEVDKKLAPLLKEKFKDFKNVEIVEDDALKFQATSYKLQAISYKIIANIPYNITSAILEKFLSAEHKPSLMALLVQREVAERVCARPGEMSFLSVMVQYYGQPKVVARVPAGAFFPPPKVESAILKWVKSPLLGKPACNACGVATAGREGLGEVEKTAEANLFRLVKLGFSHRRQTLKNNLKFFGQERVAQALSDLGLKPTARAQELTVGDWQKLLCLLIW